MLQAIEIQVITYSTAQHPKQEHRSSHALKSTQTWDKLKIESEAFVVANFQTFFSIGYNCKSRGEIGFQILPAHFIHLHFLINLSCMEAKEVMFTSSPLK